MQDPSSFLHKNFAVAMNRAPDEVSYWNSRLDVFGIQSIAWALF